MEKISCVLICKEKEYPKIVMERLTLGFFDEILVYTECPSVYERYKLAKRAKNDVIYVQDSDCLVNYQILYSKYNGDITNTMTDQFQQFYEPLGCTLVGWGTFFPKSLLSVFKKYIDRYGEDEHLLREADRIFTYLNKPFNTIMMPHEDLKRANDSTAMWKEPEHFPSAYEAIKKCSLL
jgi:hypothetical protein